MLTNPVAELTREHAGANESGRVVLAEKGEVSRAALDEVEAPRASVVAARPEPLGTTGGLARILAAMTRQAYDGPRDRERARANADRLLETIRVLSIL